MNTIISARLRAFTLIELLVVVAIIGILSAIAVPNFLNAQMKAKLSRSMTDLRSVYDSIKIMQTDTGYLPIDHWDYESEEGKTILREEFGGVGMAPSGQRRSSDILAVLTSPVAYMSTVPNDPFVDNRLDPADRGYEGLLDSYLYIDEDPRIPGVDMFFSVFAMQDRPDLPCQIRPIHKGDFILLSPGPDGRFGDRNTADGNALRGLPFNPSNGITSVGDIYIRCDFCFFG